MYNKNYTFWFKNAFVIFMMIFIFANTTFADWYSQYELSYIDDMESETVLEAPDSTSNSRTTIGIGEQVVCSIDSSTWEDLDCRNGWEIVEDTIGDTVWGAVGAGTVTPSGTTQSDETTLTAGMSPDSCLVTVDIYDSGDRWNDTVILDEILFNIIAPSSQTYSKDHDAPTWTTWTSGPWYMAARTYFNATVQPLSVCFVNAEFQENFAGETSTWPDSDTFYHPSGTFPFVINALNRWNPDDEHFTGGPYVIDKLYTGSAWQDFTPENDLPLQYENESSSWITFYTATMVAEFYYETGEALAGVEGSEGGLQGPWQE
ncbi:hypothetical protein ACFLZ8_00835 [Planctomycetota bacterium]